MFTDGTGIKNEWLVNIRQGNIILRGGEALEIVYIPFDEENEVNVTVRRVEFYPRRPVGDSFKIQLDRGWHPIVVGPATRRPDRMVVLDIRTQELIRVSSLDPAYWDLYDGARWAIICDNRPSNIFVAGAYHSHEEAATAAKSFDDQIKTYIGEVVVYGRVNEPGPSSQPYVQTPPGE